MLTIRGPYGYWCMASDQTNATENHMAPTPRTARRFRRLPSLTLTVAIAVCTPPAPASYDDGDWPTYGRDAGGSKYSPLDRITPENVGVLEVAWQWETGEAPIPGPLAPIRGQQVRPGNFETTPVAFNDTLYFTTPYNRVIALDGSSGETIWDFDPRTVEWGQPPNGTGFVHRGVAVWTR